MGGCEGRVLFLECPETVTPKRDLLREFQGVCQQIRDHSLYPRGVCDHDLRHVQSTGIL